MLIEKEKYKTRHIPPNFENGINIAGMNFEPRFLVEGLSLFLVLVGITFYFLYYVLNIEISNVLGFTLTIGLLGFVFGIKGINDEPVTVFLKNYLDCKKRKRTAFYNPRVKREAKPYTFTKENKDMLPRDKLIEILNKFKDKLNKISAKKAKDKQFETIYDSKNMYFIDDEGHVKKPREYMNKQEARAYDKQQIKRQKELLKIAKKKRLKEKYKDD